MHSHFSFHHVSRSPQIEKTIGLHIRKLEKLLGRFSSDLIRLHGVVEYTAAHQGPVCSLNLWLPTARLNSREGAATPLDALQACFSQLTEQVKKHKQFLRREGVWKRRRYKFQQEAQELEAAEVRIKNRQQLREYLDQVLPQLSRFIARELRYREIAGILPPGEAQQEEVVNEVVARALESVEAKLADSAPPFHRLISEAIRVLNGPLGRPLQAVSDSSAVAGAVAAQEVSESVANAPRERKHRASGLESELPLVLPPDAVDFFLANLPILYRQVYVLLALEGFSGEEAAPVLEKSPAEIEEIFQEVKAKVTVALRQGEATSWPGSASA